MNIRLITLLSLLSVTTFFACDDDDQGPSIDVPDTYEFSRNNESSVSFSGQTTRILMGEELIAAMKDFSFTAQQLQDMYANPDGVDPFGNADLNASTKSIQSKVAASVDYFSTNTVAAATIKEDFANWLNAQVSEVFPANQQLATAGTPGQIADGSSVRYVNAQGLEYNQMVNKSLIGALMMDQMLNNYLSTAVLDEASNRTENDNGTTVEAESYTNMEHKWDEAYGYLYGLSANPAEPNLTIGDDDNFLNEYVGRVASDPDFMTIGDDIFEAFKLGRAAIVAGDYKLRDEQAAIIREQVSKVIAVRGVYYLQQGKKALETTPIAYGGVFHDLSEAYGFIYSLQFSRRGDAQAPYFDNSEVQALLTDLLGGGANGLWDVTPATIDTISTTIATAFGFTVAEAAE